MGEKFRFYAFKLTGVIAVIFVLQMLISGFTDFFVLNSNAIDNFQIWRFVSAVFLHGGIGHLFYNGFALLLFGSILEKLVGGKRFLLIFFVTGILANMLSINFYSSSLGASGAIFGVIGVLIIIRPGLPVWAFGVPMPIFLAGIIWAGGDIIGAVGFLSGNPLDNTGNIAHLSGMLFGFLYGFAFRFRNTEKKENSVKVVFDENLMRNWEDGYMR